MEEWAADFRDYIERIIEVIHRSDTFNDVTQTASSVDCVIKILGELGLTGMERVRRI